jgi:hypothetical protein
MRGAPSQPENHTPLQIFKEHVLTEIGGAAKSVSYIYRFLPVRAFSSAVRPQGDDQRAPKATKSHRILNFQPVAHPKPLPNLYLFFTKLNSGLSGLVKPVVFRSFSGLADGPQRTAQHAITTL